MGDFEEATGSPGAAISLRWDRRHQEGAEALPRWGVPALACSRDAQPGMPVVPGTGGSHPYKLFSSFAALWPLSGGCKAALTQSPTPEPSQCLSLKASLL